MKKITVLVCLVILALNIKAQVNNDSITNSNKKLIKDLKYRINTIDNIGKTKSEEELEVEALKMLVKKQNDSIVKLNALLTNYANVLNSAPIGDGKFSDSKSVTNANNEYEKTHKKTHATQTNVALNTGLNNVELIIQQLKANCNCELLMYEPYQTLLSYNNYSELKNIAEQLKLAPTKQLTIIGHADKSGDEVKNVKLSKLRAQNLKSYFVDELSIKASSIKIDWKGSSLPLSTLNSQNESLNRRTEITLH